MKTLSHIAGNTTEAESLCYLTKLGITVSLPFCGNERYDQIWDVNGKLYRVQIKHSSISDDRSYISFNTTSNSKYTEDEIDGFATYCNGKLYYIPFGSTPIGKTVKLWFTCPSNSNSKQIKFAFDYELENFFKIF